MKLGFENAGMSIVYLFKSRGNKYIVEAFGEFGKEADKCATLTSIGMNAVEVVRSVDGLQQPDHLLRSCVHHQRERQRKVHLLLRDM